MRGTLRLISNWKVTPTCNTSAPLLEVYEVTKPSILLRPVAVSLMVTGSPARMARPVPTVSARAVTWLPIGKAGIVICVAEVVTILPSVTVQAEDVKAWPFAVVQPSIFMGWPVSSSNSPTNSWKSSRFDRGARSDRARYMGLELQIPRAEHERPHGVMRSARSYGSIVDRDAGGRAGCVAGGEIGKRKAAACIGVIA